MDSQSIDCKFAKFAPGKIIYHKHQGYRGVIYDVDDSFQAEEDWYEENKTKPDKNQPWYHVLVDGEDHTTYVAEENLLHEDSPEPVEHPLIEDYFVSYQDGQYERPMDA